MLIRGGARLAVAVMALSVLVAGLLVLAGMRATGPAATLGAPPVPPQRPVAAPSAAAPVTEQSFTEKELGPEEVLAGVYVSNIQSVNLATNSFDADFYVWLRWRNPDMDPTGSVEVMNPYQSWALVVTPVYDKPQRQSDGSLLWLTRYQGSFNAPLSLSDYPFEKQNLRILIEDGVDTTQRVTYRPDADPIKLDSEVTLPGYHIGQPRIDFGEFTYESAFGQVQSTRADRTYPRITVDIPLSSPAVSGIAKTVLPIIIVLIASGLALVIPVSHIDAKISLVITSLLALVAMHWGVSSSLPDAGYLLMIDVLYLLAYAAVTAILAVSIASAWKVKSQGEQPAMVMEHRMLVAIGAAFLLSFTAVMLFYLPEGPIR